MNCLHRGIELRAIRIFPLTRRRPDCYWCKCVKPTTQGKTLESRQQPAQYRVLKHGTPTPDVIPSFHTPNQRARNHGNRSSATALPSTDLPSYRSPAYRAFAHDTTVFPCTERHANTALRYTASTLKSACSLLFPPHNCTKLRSKLYNWGVDDCGLRKGSVP